VATASGLFVAMTGLLAFNALNNKVRGVLHQLDIVKVMLLNRLDGAPVVSASKPMRPPRPVRCPPLSWIKP